MFNYIKSTLRNLSLPKDPMFKRRAKSSSFFGKWVIVEIGANDYSVLLDMLNAIRISDADSDTKGRQIVGLRYCALAMSLRTKSGRIPLNYNHEQDLLWLGTLPFSEIETGIKEVARISDIPWLDPNLTTEEQPKEQVEYSEPSQEEIEANPS